MLKKIYRYSFIVIGIIFLIGIVIQLKNIKPSGLSDIFLNVGIFNIFISLVFYFISHLLRVIRLSILFNDESIKLNQILKYQLYTNGMNIIIPFRLGEIFRIFEFNKIVNNYRVTVLSIFAERTIDFIVLIVGLLIALVFIDTSNLNLQLTVLVSIIIVLALIYAYYVLPNNLNFLNLYLAKRTTSETLIRILNVSGKFHKFLIHLRQILHARISPVIILTMMIWVCEIIGFSFVIRFLPNFELVFLLALFVFLSILIPGGSFGFGGVQLGFYLIALINPDFKFLELSYVYQIFIFLPAIVVAFISYFNKNKS